MKTNKKVLTQKVLALGLVGMNFHFKLEHMLKFKEWYLLIKDTEHPSRLNLLENVTQEMLPFLEHFKDVQHPQFDNIWANEEDDSHEE